MSDLTKRALSNSLKKLLKSKPLVKITVSDLTEDCGVNRQTFYYHFADLADLVEWTCLEDADEALEDKKTYTTWQEGFLRIFALMKKDEPFINNIYHSVQLDILEEYLYKLVYPLLKNVVDEEAKGMEVREEDKAFIADFYKFAFVGLVLEWIKKGMKDDPERIIARLSVLIQGTIPQALNNYRYDKVPPLSKN
jgi:probable dihydroxyacetone kinase regulator